MLNRSSTRRACVVVSTLLLSLAPVRAAPLTAERIEAADSALREAWREYLARSEARARADREALEAELRTLGLEAGRQAPSGGDFKLPEKADPSWYSSSEAARLAEVVLSYQTPAGGWSKHTGYASGPRRPGTQFTSQNEPGKPPHYLGTFDNGSTTEQIWLLARVGQATGREDCKAGLLRGVDYILDAQYPSGGWPQVYPLEGGYHDDITFNDGAMTHVLEVLLAIRDGAPAFASLDEPRRARATRAFDAGLACLMKLQVEQGGKKTVWCAQHDALTLAPSSARKMEPATLSGLESADILKFLMTIRAPSPELVASIEAGLAWLEQAKITNIAKRKVEGKTVYQIDPSSTEVYWARFYELGTGRPVFPGRDGVVYDTYEAMVAKNAAGYDYYTTLPGSIVRNGQKNWRKMLASERKP